MSKNTYNTWIEYNGKLFCPHCQIEAVKVLEFGKGLVEYICPKCGRKITVKD